jgi:hypothetical protein
VVPAAAWIATLGALVAPALRGALAPAVVTAVLEVAYAVYCEALKGVRPRDAVWLRFLAIASTLVALEDRAVPEATQRALARRLPRFDVHYGFADAAWLRLQPAPAPYTDLPAGADQWYGTETEWGAPLDVAVPTPAKETKETKETKGAPAAAPDAAGADAARTLEHLTCEAAFRLYAIDDLQLLGCGVHGRVVGARRTEDGRDDPEQYAVKIVELVGGDREAAAAAQRDAFYLAKLRTLVVDGELAVPTLHAVWRCRRRVRQHWRVSWFFAMQRFDGDLQQRAYARARESHALQSEVFTDAEVRRMFRLAAAIGVCDPDLKPAQYLWRRRADSSTHIVLTDFGFAGSDSGSPYLAHWGWIGGRYGCPPALAPLGGCAFLGGGAGSGDTERAFAAFLNCLVLEASLMNATLRDAASADASEPRVRLGDGSERRFVGLSGFRRDLGAPLQFCGAYTDALVGAARDRVLPGERYELAWSALGAPAFPAHEPPPIRAAVS